MASVHVNGIDLYYEILGKGDPVVCLGGWGTFCHDNHSHLPRGLIDRYQVVVHDYRGIKDSSDDLSKPASMRLYAEDTIALLDSLGLNDVHLVGLVGMGACVTQEIAICRPDLARSMLNMGGWASVDTYLRDQLEMFKSIHDKMGFFAFQELVSILSFTPDYYNENKSRLLGPEGAWRELNGNYASHERLISACVGFESLDRLGQIECPSLVIHAGLDQVTSPRTTKPIETGIKLSKGIYWDDIAHVVAGKAQKVRFAETLFAWLASV
jgi:pimeloyl-ACP methyl ester carboxylesterase